MDSKDVQYMRFALDQAELALKQDWIPVGAVFVRDNHVVANARKLGDKHALFDHAEHNGCYQVLYDRALENLDGFTVYSTMEPCLMCMSMLMTTRVSRIVYGIEDPYGGGGFILKHPELLPERFQKKRPTLEGGFMRPESLGLLHRFFSEGRDERNWSDKDNALVKLIMNEAA